MPPFSINCIAWFRLKQLYSLNVFTLYSSENLFLLLYCLNLYSKQNNAAWQMVDTCDWYIQRNKQLCRDDRKAEFGLIFHRYDSLANTMRTIIWIFQVFWVQSTIALTRTSPFLYFKLLTKQIISWYMSTTIDAMSFHHKNKLKRPKKSWYYVWSAHCLTMTMAVACTCRCDMVRALRSKWRKISIDFSLWKVKYKFLFLLRRFGWRNKKHEKRPIQIWLHWLCVALFLSFGRSSSILLLSVCEFYLCFSFSSWSKSSITQNVHQNFVLNRFSNQYFRISYDPRCKAFKRHTIGMYKNISIWISDV